MTHLVEMSGKWKNWNYVFFKIFKINSHLKTKKNKYRSTKKFRCIFCCSDLLILTKQPLCSFFTTNLHVFYAGWSALSKFHLVFSPLKLMVCLCLWPLTWTSLSLTVRNYFTFGSWLSTDSQDSKIWPCDARFEIFCAQFP